MEGSQHTSVDKRVNYSLDITSQEAFMLKSDQVLMHPAETVIQEEESQWAEDINPQKNTTAISLDDP